MRRYAWLLVLLVLVAGVAAIGAQGAVEQRIIPASEWFGVPYFEGVGEEVAISGEVLYAFSAKYNNAGGYAVSLHQNGMGLVGKGLVTGNTYRLVLSTHWSTTFRIGETYTQLQRLHVISPTNQDNQFMDFLVHYTVNANGDVTANVATSNSVLHG